MGVNVDKIKVNLFAMQGLEVGTEFVYLEVMIDKNGSGCSKEMENRVVQKALGVQQNVFREKGSSMDAVRRLYE